MRDYLDRSKLSRDDIVFVLHPVTINYVMAQAMSDMGVPVIMDKLCPVGNISLMTLDQYEGGRPN